MAQFVIVQIILMFRCFNNNQPTVLFVNPFRYFCNLHSVDVE